MGKIVSTIRTRVRCDVFPCKNLASYSIGEESRRKLNFNVCEEHMRRIVENGAVLIGESLRENDETYVEPTEEPEKMPFEPDENELNAGQEDASLEEFYSCKYCGEQFPKTKEGRLELMNHSRACKKEQA